MAGQDDEAKPKKPSAPPHDVAQGKSDADAPEETEAPPDPNEIIQHVVKGDDGHVVQRFRTKGGDIDGEYLTYEEGKLSTRSFYTCGELEGVFEVYSPEGKLTSSMSYIRGILDGPATIRDDSGELLQKLEYKKGLLDGVVTVYDNGLVQSRTTYAKDKKTGSFIMYGPQSKPQIESMYINGELEGMTKVFDEEGQLLMDVPYQKGKRSGVAVEYNTLSGGIRTKTAFKNDKKHGDFLEFHEDGSVRKKIVFEDGKPVGDPIEYDTKGRRLAKKDDHKDHKH